jgi:patatin-like phospholipase/acyl hydrolase
VRILSIDGGGIRGIIPALVLAEIEDRTGRPVSDLFDLVAGTSTGGLIALALTAPGEAGRPRWSALQLAGLYEDRGQDIFTVSLFQRIRSAGGLLDERYPSAGVEAALRDYLGDARLKEALTDVLVTAYETKDRFPFFFRSARARARADYDFPMREAGRATSAAPIYFEAARVVDSTGRAYSLVDGGVFANNPAMCAYVDVIDSEPDADVVLLSLGTGELTREYPYEEVRDWGLIEWARPLVNVVFDGVSDTIDYQLQMVLDEGRYWRLQTELTRGRGSDDLDDSSRANIEALKETARELIRKHSDEIDQACATLTA